MRDVAERAGVTTATVSRVINGSEKVSPETRAKVEAVIAELGYVPNRLARSLRVKSTKTLGLLLGDLTLPFWAWVTRGVEDQASESGYSVIICNTDADEAKQAHYINLLAQKQVDGLVMVPAQSSPISIPQTKQHRLPVVALGRQIPDMEVDVVGGDSEGGAYQGTNYLLGLGHKQIAIITGPASISDAVDRMNGYQRAVTEANVDVTDRFAHFGEYSREAGYRLMRQMLQSTPRPTAIFGASTRIVMGIMGAIWEAGLRVPQDISVLCFDEMPFFPITDPEPFMTIVKQPAYQIGRKAVQVLLNRIACTEDSPAEEYILPTEMVIRRSCRAL